MAARKRKSPKKKKTTRLATLCAKYKAASRATRGGKACGVRRKKRKSSSRVVAGFGPGGFHVKRVKGKRKPRKHHTAEQMLAHKLATGEIKLPASAWAGAGGPPKGVSAWEVGRGEHGFSGRDPNRKRRKAKRKTKTKKRTTAAGRAWHAKMMRSKAAKAKRHGRKPAKRKTAHRTKRRASHARAHHTHARRPAKRRAKHRAKRRTSRDKGWFGHKPAHHTAAKKGRRIHLKAYCKKRYTKRLDRNIAKARKKYHRDPYWYGTVKARAHGKNPKVHSTPRHKAQGRVSWRSFESHCKGDPRRRPTRRRAHKAKRRGTTRRTYRRTHARGR